MAMISTPLRYQQRSPTKPRALFVLLMLPSLPCHGYAKGDLDNIINRANYVQQPYHSLRHSNSNDSRLRGRLKLNPSMKDRSKQFNDMSSSSGRDSNMKQQQSLQSLVGEETQRRSVEANLSTIFITPSSTFQIIMSILLAILILLQLSVLVRFLRNRSMRVLEFTQPHAICIFVASSIVATASCYLYIYLSSSLTCAIREPLLFMSVSLMGATVAGRAWRISTLVNNPLLTAGGDRDTNVSKVEKIRQYMLGMLSPLSTFGCSCSISSLCRRRSSNMSVRREEEKRSAPIRVQVTFVQMMRATIFMILPQLLWQVAMLSTPTLRSNRELVSTAYLYNGGHQMLTMEQYQCQSSVGLWPHCISVFLALCPYAIAYILNIRPKQELDLLPETIDEKEKLEQSFCIFARIIAVSAPVIKLSYANNPEARVYSTICAVLALPLACCYYIAYLKLNRINSSTFNKRPHGTSTAHSRISPRGEGTMGRRSTTSVFRMAEMYLRIGRTEETVQLVDETLELYRKSNAGDGVSDGIWREGRQEVSLGFTKSDLQALEEEELELIIQFLKLKMRALERLEGMPGLCRRAKMNIGALQLFEKCPVARKMKDTSFMFPMYNLAGEQIKTGAIDDDDDFSLEMELAIHCCREAQLQSYHYARSLANLAEIYGRLGLLDEAFKYFNIIDAMYMKEEHPKLLTNTYAFDGCARSYASSALWYLQKGEIDPAIERCNYVIDHIIPQYDKNDILGLFYVFIALIRVLKWNGEAGKALEAYSRFMPDAANTHWAVGSLHKATTLLLQICEGNSHQYNDEFLSDDIETVLSFDVTEPQSAYFTNYGWSMNTLAAELCMLFAQRLEADDTSRERLIDRGITMARIAQQRSTTSNGKMKHMLAFEANKDVYNKLVQLDKDSGVDAIEGFADPNPNGTISSGQDSVKIVNDNISIMSKQSQTLSVSFANKLKPSLQAVSQISVASDSKRRDFSSLDSFGSTRLSSQQSCATIQVDPSKHAPN